MWFVMSTWEMYRQCNTVERNYMRLKQSRGIVARCDKYARNFHGGVLLATTIIHASTNERDTP